MTFNITKNITLLKKILTDNIIPFWYSKILDYEYGGYKLNHDITGEFKGNLNKEFYTQIRLVWYYSHLYRKKYAGKEYIGAANHGIKFATQKMWDNHYGGFYWESNFDGYIITKPIKHIYAQSFALFAFSELEIANPDQNVSKLAEMTFRFIEENFYDNEYEGYFECLEKDLKPIRDKKQSPYDLDFNIKTLDAHIHLLEAYTNYYKVSGNILVKDRISELLKILSTKTIDQQICCFNNYNREWKPIKEDKLYSVSFGHCLENFWLMIEACEIAGQPLSILENYLNKVVGYCIDKGFDKRNGGFYLEHWINSNRINRDKIWWVQAECLLALLFIYQFTKDGKYLKYFEKTLNWINKYQADWENGEWHKFIVETKLRRHKAKGYKAGYGKTPYHNTRSILKCIEILESIQNEKD